MEKEKIGVTFSRTETATEMSDQTFTRTSGTTVRIESLDQRRVRFRVHWFPFHMKWELVEEHMEEYGSNIHILDDLLGKSVRKHTV